MIGATISMAFMAVLFVIFGVVGATEKACDGKCVGCGAGVCDNKIEGSDS